MMPAALLPALSAPPVPSSLEPAAALPIDATAAPHPPHAVVRITRALAVGGVLGLIVLGLAWELWLAPTGSRFLAFKVLPLVIPLPGLLKMRLYTYRWVSLVVWLYFAEGIVRATGVPPGAALGTGEWLAWGQVALCCGLFAACTLHVRWRLKHPAPETPA
jgi:uncharacterized membrane protein